MSYVGNPRIDERISLLGNQYINDDVHHNNQLHFPHNIISYIFNLRFRPFFIIFIALTILSIISIAICFSSSSPTVHIVSEPAQFTQSPNSPPVGYEHCNLTDSDCTFNLPPKPTSTISPNDPFSLLDNDPQFQEMSVYFPKMLLLSNPYNAESTSIPTTLPFIHHSQTDDDDDDDSEDEHDGALRKILDDVPKKNYNKVKRQIEKEELARQNHDHHFPHVSMSETTNNDSSSTSDTLTRTRSITSFAEDKNIDSNTTTVFKFYPGATEIDPNIHIGIGYSWFPTSISNHTQSSDRILQHSIIRSSNSNGVKTIHVQFDAPSIYIKLESQSDDEKNTGKGKKSKMNEQLHDEFDSSFRSFLYESHRDDITPIITLHYFQPHRDQYQWDWLDTKTIKSFVKYAKSIFPFFVKGGVDKIVTIHNWENYCTRTYSTNLFNAQLCQHNILKAHIETVTSLRQQCNDEQLIPILSNSNKLLHQHSKHRSKTKLSSSMRDKLNKFCSNIKFSIGLQSSYYISRIKNQIARIDYQLDYSTQSMTRLGSTLLSGHSGNKDYDFFESCPDVNANMIQSGVVFSCDSNSLAQSHANLLSIGNTLNILFKGDNSRLYRKLITVALKSHEKITKKRDKSSKKNSEASLNTTTGHKVDGNNDDDELLNVFQFTKQERKMFKNNQPDFIYLEYSTTKYVFYDESCLDQVNTKFNQEQHRIQQSLQNPQAVHNFTFKARHPEYDLNCLRYTDFDITGLPIGPHPTPMVGNEHISTTNSKHPNSISRLVPRGLTLLLQYVSDVTYLLKHPKKQRPPSLIPNVQLKTVNTPIIVAISVLMPHFDEMHQPKLDVLIKNSNYNPKAPNLRAQLYGASCLQDYYRTNALALYLTEVAMSTSQRNVNVISVLYNNFIDPSHFDPTAKRNYTSGLVHVSDSNTLIDKLSMLWLQSETLFHSHPNDSTNNK